MVWSLSYVDIYRHISTYSTKGIGLCTPHQYKHTPEKKVMHISTNRARWSGVGGGGRREDGGGEKRGDEVRGEDGGWGKGGGGGKRRDGARGEKIAREII